MVRRKRDTFFRNAADTTLEEFTAFILDQHLGLTEEQARRMFEFAHGNCHGAMSSDELRALTAPALQSAMSLPVRVIVPSTQGVSGNISAEEMRGRCDEVLLFMASVFGGATATAPQRGAYRAESGDVVLEEVVSVVSHATPQLWKENVDAVHSKVKDLCAEWEQECIGLDFGGLLEYVYPGELTGEQLW
eukprot:CAMPEP_0172551330 /NCGR_PEP_ID=MMETSP1067-20121228/38178_1 /TAXON_ID=265564 ORGANISM="Thalassiosira punctigera, Strain Tpunct2005C2" /NCGR_SAMPLE_ID=MMETSP1067 /ASSEMBLY_ACC=CAM_ASM_000444 /LENGTH=189 /DNA_ID=CAMNT_0013339099 /DNA_START=53 /DNA_END=619 /DNA_ORIENTATION=+